MVTTPRTDPSTAQAQADLEEIRRVILLYGQLLDDARFDAWAELFTEDAEFISIPGGHLRGGGERSVVKGRRNIVEVVSESQRKGLAEGGVLHFGGSPVIDLFGDRAKAYWSFMVFYVAPGSIETRHAGRYHADLVRSGGRWRFERRISVRAGHPLPEGMEPSPER